MAKPGFGKRERERKREQEQKSKDAKRAQRREDRKNRPDGFDPYTVVPPEPMPTDE